MYVYGKSLHMHAFVREKNTRASCYASVIFSFITNHHQMITYEWKRKHACRKCMYVCAKTIHVRHGFMHASRVCICPSPRRAVKLALQDMHGSVITQQHFHVFARLLVEDLHSQRYACMAENLHGVYEHGIMWAAIRCACRAWFLDLHMHTSHERVACILDHFLCWNWIIKPLSHRRPCAWSALE